MGKTSYFAGGNKLFSSRMYLLAEDNTAAIEKQ